MGRDTHLFSYFHYYSPMRRRIKKAVGAVKVASTAVVEKTNPRQRKVFFKKLDNTIHKDVMSMFSRLGTVIHEAVLPESKCTMFEPKSCIKQVEKEKCIIVGRDERQVPIMRKQLCKMFVSTEEMPNDLGYSYVKQF